MSARSAHPTALSKFNPERSAWLDPVELEISEGIAFGGAPIAAIQHEEQGAPSEVDLTPLGIAATEVAGDEDLVSAMEVAIPDAMARPQLRAKHLQLLVRCLARHRLVAQVHRAEAACRAGLDRTRLLPAGIEQMRVERPDLRKVRLRVPRNGTVGARVDQIEPTPGLLWIDHDNAVRPLDHSVGRDLAPGRIVAVVAAPGDVSHVDPRPFSPDRAIHPEPLVALGGLGRLSFIAKPRNLAHAGIVGDPVCPLRHAAPRGEEVQATAPVGQALRRFHRVVARAGMALTTPGITVALASAPQITTDRPLNTRTRSWCAMPREAASAGLRRRTQ